MSPSRTRLEERIGGQGGGGDKKPNQTNKFTIFYHTSLSRGLLCSGGDGIIYAEPYFYILVG